MKCIGELVVIATCRLPASALRTPNLFLSRNPMATVPGFCRPMGCPFSDILTAPLPGLGIDSRLVESKGLIIDPPIAPGPRWSPCGR